jgi:hypothetical protein
MIYAMASLLIQFDRQLIGLDSLIFLGHAPLQSEIQLAPTHGLCKEIRNAFLIMKTFVRAECHHTLRESLRKVHLLSKIRHLVGPYLDSDLDACFPTPFFHVEYTGQEIGLSINRLGPEEERDAIRWGVSS